MCFVAQVDEKLIPKLIKDLEDQGFEIAHPPHTHFSAKKKGLSCTAYTSGKLVVQGKEMDEFIEFYLEPQILKTFSYKHGEQLNETARIGVDEAGKGDFFGPLCVAAVYAHGEDFKALKELGVKDSKSFSDAPLKKLAVKIRARFAHHIVKINPLKYNELYAQFRNLNRLLGWGHATAIESLILKTGCRKVIIDQFADESVVIGALKRKKIELELTQRHRAEEDIVVAAASILARETFLEGLAALGRQFEFVFPKGASAAVIDAGVKFASKWGKAELEKVGKKHFKTLDAILTKIPE